VLTGLKDRVVIVAGASQGIGRAAAEMFAAEGAKLAIFARTPEKIEAAEEEIAGKHHVEVLAQVVDATDATGVKRFVQSVIERFGRVDVCVANAAGPPTRGFLQASDEDWNHAFQSNLMSIVYLTREVIPHMRERRWGRVITITSVSVRMPIPDLLLSNSIRPAVLGLLKSLVGEFAQDGITFNNVGPGYTTTERLMSLTAARAKAAGVAESEIFAKWSAEVPSKRLAKPEEIASAIVWLASEGAAYVNGQTILVDGGRFPGL
jgi:3-oxoacyl-[acyl-carrier protein] reductase